MRKLSEVQSTLMRLRKKYRKAIESQNAEDIQRLSNTIRSLEWVLEIQNTPTTVETD